MPESFKCAHTKLVPVHQLQPNPQNPNNQGGIDTNGFSTLDDYTMLSNLAANLKTKSGASYVTAAPYTAQSFWKKVTGLSWWNVQFYAGVPGGISNVPAADWLSNLQSWAQAAGKSADFIVAGCGQPPVGGFDSSSLQNGLANCVNGHSTPGGAFIWTWQTISDPATWTAAISKGLQGETTP